MIILEKSRVIWPVDAYMFSKHLVKLDDRTVVDTAFTHQNQVNK
jgi:hypothetical protein